MNILFVLQDFRVELSIPHEKRFKSSNNSHFIDLYRGNILPRPDVLRMTQILLYPIVCRFSL